MLLTAMLKCSHFNISLWKCCKSWVLLSVSEGEKKCTCRMLMNQHTRLFWPIPLQSVRLMAMDTVVVDFDSVTGIYFFILLISLLMYLLISLVILDSVGDHYRPSFDWDQHTNSQKVVLGKNMQSQFNTHNIVSLMRVIIETHPVFLL